MEKGAPPRDFQPAWLVISTARRGVGFSPRSWYLAGMTGIVTPPKPPRPPGRWLLQDAKARFSELVRRARSEGPQHVTVHGRDEVVVVAADEFRRLKGEGAGAALIAAMQASPYRQIDIEPSRDERSPVRDVEL